MSDPVTALTAWLTEAHRALKKTESDALAALYENKDEAVYRALMRERAGRLAALPAGGKSLLEAVPEPLRGEVGQALSRFAGGARRALELDSVFYMSALLYPDEHKAGDPDNLERLIAGMRMG
ncbi:MAG: hypothetical protein FWG04_00645 [Desulfovibrionaceae bacterium]|nr:hypothetical protein [Desulfovibrionaceae bacterium]